MVIIDGSFLLGMAAVIHSIGTLSRMWRETATHIPARIVRRNSRRRERWHNPGVLGTMQITLKLVGSAHHSVDGQVQEVPDVLVAAERATKAARYAIAADVLAGIPVNFDGRVDVMDHGGNHISSIRFADVLAAKAA